MVGSYHWYQAHLHAGLPHWKAYVPAPHCAQAVLTTSLLALPGGHIRQAVALASSL